jgi:hypothetical protein
VWCRIYDGVHDGVSCGALLVRTSEKTGDETPPLLKGKDGVHTEALDERVGAVPAPGETIPRLRPAQVDDPIAIVEFAREGREDGIVGVETLLVGENAGIRPPHVSQPVLVNVVYEAPVRWLEHPEQLAQELFQRVRLVKDHGRVVAREIDRTPPHSIGAQFHNPEIAVAVRRNRKSERKDRPELEHEIPPAEIYLFDRSVETTAGTQQLRDLLWNLTRQPAGKVPQLLL